MRGPALRLDELERRFQQRDRLRNSAGVLVAGREEDACGERFGMFGPDLHVLEFERGFEERDRLAVRPPSFRATARWLLLESVTGWSGPNFASISLMVDVWRAIDSASRPASQRATARFWRVMIVFGWSAPFADSESLSVTRRAGWLRRSFGGQVIPGQVVPVPDRLRVSWPQFPLARLEGRLMELDRVGDATGGEIGVGELAERDERGGMVDPLLQFPGLSCSTHTRSGPQRSGRRRGRLRRG